MVARDGSEKVLLANPRGFCAGVERAIAAVEIALRTHGPPVYVRKEIVHNPHVVADLKRKGAVFVESEDAVPHGGVVIFSAHGVAPQVRERAGERALIPIDATCPLVARVHLEARKYARDGYSVLLIGHAGHDEIIGTMGEAPQAIQLIENVRAASRVQVSNPARVVCLTQTTLSVDDTRDVVAALKERFPSLVVRDDICYATQNRQTAVKALAKEVDVVLVMGASNSSNSVRLMEVAGAHGVRAYRISDAGEIDPRWLEGARTVGITSGASTPEIKVTEAVALLRALGIGGAVEVRVLEEHVAFALPKELQRFTNPQAGA